MLWSDVDDLLMEPCSIRLSSQRHGHGKVKRENERSNVKGPAEDAPFPFL